MTVTIAAFMPLAIPVVRAPIFTRVTMLDAIEFASGFTLTAILIADPRAALFANYLAVVLPVLDPSSAIVLPILDSRGAIVLPILDAGLMLIAGRLMIGLLSMTRLGMRII